MRFAPVITVVAVAVSGAAANPLNFDLNDIIGHDISFNNHYGAPNPPWAGGRPGWYYGNHPSNHRQYPCLTGVC